jgi:uncharacterized protein involved in exopolysaccharide biosynthesis
LDTKASTNEDGNVATGVDFDFLQAWKDIWSFKGVAISMAAIITAASVAVALLATPIYRVTTVLLPVDESAVGGALRGLGDLGALAAVAGLGAGGGDLAVEAEAILRSRKFSEDFIRERDLLPVLFANKWDADRSKWRVSGDDIPAISDGFQLFDRKVRRVIKDRKSGLLSLSIEWKDPVVAADWANDLVRRVNETMRSRALEESAATIAQLKKQLAATNLVPLESSVAEFLEAQIKKQTFAKVRTEFALRVVDPAIVPGPDEQVFPRKGLLAVGGLATGIGLGLFVALMLAQIRRRKAVEAVSVRA